MKHFSEVCWAYVGIAVWNWLEGSDCFLHLIDCVTFVLRWYVYQCSVCHSVWLHIPWCELHVRNYISIMVKLSDDISCLGWPQFGGPEGGRNHSGWWLVVGFPKTLIACWVPFDESILRSRKFMKVPPISSVKWIDGYENLYAPLQNRRWHQNNLDSWNNRSYQRWRHQRNPFTEKIPTNATRDPKINTDNRSNIMAIKRKIKNDNLTKSW